MLYPKTQSGKKYACFVISEVFFIYGVFVIFISKVKNSHLSVSLASFQNFDQSGCLFWILRFHTIKYCHSWSWFCSCEISEAYCNEVKTIMFNHGTIVVLPPFMISGCLNKVLVCYSYILQMMFGILQIMCLLLLLSHQLENNFDVTVCF